MNRSDPTSCLIIGASGFVGSAVAQAARAAGWQVTAVGRADYAPQRGRRFDVVLNAAGNARRFKANREPLWDFDQSVRPVYASLADFECAHYALISSVDVYNVTGSPESTAEDAAIDLLQLPPYGFHRRLAELCVIRQAPSWQVFRLAQMVGPGLKKGPILDLLEERPLWVDPASELPYMHTDNVGRTVVELIERAPRNQVYNVCGRGSVPLARVLELLGRDPARISYAARERQTYRINTEKTQGHCRLPDSWNELRSFVQSARAAHHA